MRGFCRTILSVPLWIAAFAHIGAAGACVHASTQSANSSTGSQSADEGEKPSPTGDGFKFKFENPRFFVRLIEIDIGQTGDGHLRLKRGEVDEIIDRKLSLLPSTMSVLNELVARSAFLSSSEEYQTKKDFSHLGWITITARQGHQERTVRFNYTAQAQIAELAAIFRAIADQELDLLDVEIAVQNEPLDLPRVLDALENDLRESHLAEPQQLVKPLRAIAQEDSLPLIARNQAGRLVLAIEKGKYKGPFRIDK